MNFNLSDAIAILKRTPTVLNSLLNGLSLRWTEANEGENTWSPYDIVGHLIHGEKTDWIPRTKIILGDNDNKTFIPFDRFAQFRESQGKNMETLLQEFSDLREENINYITSLNLTENDLHKEGIHPDFGVVTLKQLLSTWTVHDLNHISQTCRVMAKQYKGETGPWVDYLGIFA